MTDVKITCPQCGNARDYSLGIVAKLKSPVCRKCLHGHKPKVICPTCGKTRYADRPSIGLRLKTFQCRPCAKKSRAVKVVCPRCGKVKEFDPGEAKKLKTSYCRGCPQIHDTALPDTFEAGYVCGVVVGDGCLSTRIVGNSRVRIIILAVTDLAFATRFSDSLQACTGKSPWRKSQLVSKKGNPSIGMPPRTFVEHKVCLTSQEWYEKLAPIKIGRDWSIVRGKSILFKRGFFQGLLDSEGYVNHKSGYTDIANKDLDLLKYLVEVAEELGHKANVYGPYPYARGVAHLRIRECLQKTVEVNQSCQPILLLAPTLSGLI